MQVNNPQKPKNDEIRIDGQTIRLTEPIDETTYLTGNESNKAHLERSVEEFNSTEESHETDEEVEKSISQRWARVPLGTIGAY